MAKPVITSRSEIECRFNSCTFAPLRLRFENMTKNISVPTAFAAAWASRRSRRARLRLDTPRSRAGGRIAAPRRDPAVLIGKDTRISAI